MKIENSLAKKDFTYVTCEDPEEQKFDCPYHFKIINKENNETMAVIDFQQGPVKENGFNGVYNEDLLLIVLTRLEAFQKSPFACRENQKALENVEEALMWLRKRTDDRRSRGVLGTNQK